MKRITILFLLVTVMMGAVSFTEAAVAKPESGKMYNIVHSRTGFYLTATVESQGAYISPASGNVNQRFYIIEQEDGVYKIQEAKTNLYWYKRDAWDTGWSSNPAEQGDRALFELPVKGDNVLLECYYKSNNNNFFGTGDNNSTTWVSSDRYDSEVNSLWHIEEYNPQEVVTAALEYRMNEIRTFMDGVVFGDGSREYSLAIKAELEAKLTEADGLLKNSGVTQQQIDTVLNELDILFSELKASQNPFVFDPEGAYYIIHSSGFYLTAVDVNYTYLSSGEGNENQRFKIEAIKDGEGYYYVIRRNTTGEYWYRRERWDTGWTSDPESLSGDVNGTSVLQPGRAQFNIYESGNKDYDMILETKFVFAEDNGFRCMGAGSGTNGEWISSDKYQNDVKSYWRLVKYDPNVAIKGLLYEEIQIVTEFLGNRNVKSGNNPGEYYPEVYDALKNKLAEANDIYENSTSQEEVNQVKSELEEAYNLCRSSINIIKPTDREDYYITFEQDYTMTDRNDAVYMWYKDESSVFNFKSAIFDETVYYQIQNQATGKYMYLTDGDSHELKWTDDADAAGDNALFQFESAADLDNPKNVILKVKGTDVYVGNDMSGSSEGDKWREINGKSKAMATPWLIEPVEQPNSISNNEMNDIYSYVVGDILYVKNLSGTNRISVYSISGSLVMSKSCDNEEFSVSLPTGIYVVAITGNVTKTIGIVVK